MAGARHFSSFRVAFFPDLAFLGATWARRASARAFVVALGSFGAGARAVSVVSTSDVIVFSPLAVITVTTWITLKRMKCKQNLRARKADGIPILSPLIGQEDSSNYNPFIDASNTADSRVKIWRIRRRNSFPLFRFQPPLGPRKC
jgi:hypothetical protein